MEKGLKEIQAHTATPLHGRVCVCDVLLERGCKDFSPTPPPHSNYHPSMLLTCYLYMHLLYFPPHSSSPGLIFFSSCLSLVLLQGAWCEIHHVLKLHHPQRTDESPRSLFFWVSVKMLSEMIVTPSVCVIMSFPAIAP